MRYYYFIPHLSVGGLQTLLSFLTSLKIQADKTWNDVNFDLCVEFTSTEEVEIVNAFIKKFDLSHCVKDSRGTIVHSNL